VPTAEIACYVPLLLGDDGGRAFLQIMRGFEATADKQRHYLPALRSRPYPAQVVWGVRDRMPDVAPLRRTSATCGRAR
jgi:haloalkane dehalogenase